MKRLFSAALTGAEVANAQGERLAVLRDLAVDVGSSFVSYAIVDRARRESRGFCAPRA